MIKIIHILVVGLFLMDMILCYRYVNAYKKMYPKSAWWLAEANPILKYLMKTFGLLDGMVYGGMIIFGILITSVSLLPDYYGVFLLGMYFMNNTYHFVNWQALKRLQKEKEVKD